MHIPTTVQIDSRSYTGDLFEPLQELPNPVFDWIASNPPYVGTSEASILPPDITGARARNRALRWR